uniref:ribosomal RNA-processing protein 8 isoform X1 n=2 Tax=Myxine glutinosa TaxID=7769 RepID=UPI00358E38A2
MRQCCEHNLSCHFWATCHLSSTWRMFQIVEWSDAGQGTSLAEVVFPKASSNTSVGNDAHHVGVGRTVLPAANQTPITKQRHSRRNGKKGKAEKTLRLSVTNEPVVRKKNGNACKGTKLASLGCRHNLLHDECTSKVQGEWQHKPKGQGKGTSVGAPEEKRIEGRVKHQKGKRKIEGDATEMLRGKRKKTNGEKLEMPAEVKQYTRQQWKNRFKNKKRSRMRSRVGFEGLSGQVCHGSGVQQGVAYMAEPMLQQGQTENPSEYSKSLPERNRKNFDEAHGFGFRSRKKTLSQASSKTVKSRGLAMEEEQNEKYNCEVTGINSQLSDSNVIGPCSAEQVQDTGRREKRNSLHSSNKTKRHKRDAELSSPRFEDTIEACSAFDSTSDNICNDGGEEKGANQTNVNRGQISKLRAKAEARLRAARFRMLNETLYKSRGCESKDIFQCDPEAFRDYHEGYLESMKNWPFDPLNRIVNYVKHGPSHLRVADFGCGDARLARSVPNKVYSFDLVALNSDVTVCDMAKVPLDDCSVDIVVFCLSLMGTNLRDYLQEANRVLENSGKMKIAEVSSRFTSVCNFVNALSTLGFKIVSKDLKHSHFFMFEFEKVSKPKAKQDLQGLELRPCVYKKR